MKCVYVIHNIATDLYNDNQFTQLKDAKEEHKKQGLIYLYCAEERRLWLHKHYKSVAEFNASYKERYQFFEEHYQHMKGGHKFTRAYLHS